MRIAILSDIHANITALAAVVDDLKQQNVEALYCLGDISLQWTKKNVTLGRKAFLQSLKAEIIPQRVDAQRASTPPSFQRLTARVRSSRSSDSCVIRSSRSKSRGKRLLPAVSVLSVRS